MSRLKKERIARRIFSALITLSITASFIAAFSNAEAEVVERKEEERKQRLSAKVEMPELEVEQIEDDDAQAVFYSTFYRDDIPFDEITQLEMCNAAQSVGIDPLLVAAVIWKETRFENVVGDSGASIGYMQVQPRWHMERMERCGCFDRYPNLSASEILMIPSENFIVGSTYLADLLSFLDLENALTVYNSGSRGCNQYARDVIAKYNEYLKK